jgi:hypothetical protein
MVVGLDLGICSGPFGQENKERGGADENGPDDPIKVKMLALTLRAMAESDLPKQAEQASAHGEEARTNGALKMTDKADSFHR